MADLPISAEVFAHAVERIARFRGQTVVVKLGGSAMEDPAATDACMQSVAVLQRLGVPIILVHGGGTPIDRAMTEAGLVPRKVAGRRYTDEATLEIVVRVLGDINRDLVARLASHGTDARSMIDSEPFPMTGSPLQLIEAGERVDLGWVGQVDDVDVPGLMQWAWLTDCGDVSVVPSLARCEESPTGWLNVNADTAASAVAGALAAEKAIFLTDTPGVLRDRADPTTLLPRLTEQECRALIASGVIDGGMVPKVEACFEALAAGAKSALILDGREPFSLLDVFLRDSFSGTEITK